MIALRHFRHLLFVILTVGGASCISLIGGIGIEAVQEKLLPLIPLLIALPALNTMVGDYAAIIAAHAGDPGEQKDSKRNLAIAIAKVIWVNILGVLMLSVVIAWQRDYLFTGEFLVKFIGFVIVSMLAIVVAMFGITIVLDKALENHKLSADDVLIPIVTTLTDVMMLGLIAFAAYFLF